MNRFYGRIEDALASLAARLTTKLRGKRRQKLANQLYRIEDMYLAIVRRESANLFVRMRKLSPTWDTDVLRRAADVAAHTAVVHTLAQLFISTSDEDFEARHHMTLAESATSLQAEASKLLAAEMISANLSGYPLPDDKITN